MARHRVTCVLKSTYVSSCSAPTLNAEERDVLVEFINDGRRIVQRAVSANSLYGSSKGRDDTVAVSGDMQEMSVGWCNGIEKISVWFEKALAFFRVSSDTLKNGSCTRHKKCVNCACDPNKELCFVQRYEVVYDRMLKVDQIYKTLGGLRFDSIEMKYRITAFSRANSFL